MDIDKRFKINLSYEWDMLKNEHATKAPSPDNDNNNSSASLIDR